jgi:hypothetical protein
LSIPPLNHIRLNCSIDGACWTWAGQKTGKDYPLVYWKGKRLSVRRVVGKLESGLFARMKCGNPLCVAPHHIVRLTRSQYKKGQEFTLAAKLAMTRGQRKRPDRKLTMERAKDIRVRLIAGEPAKEVAKAEGISRQAVDQIKLNRVWRETTPFSI